MDIKLLLVKSITLLYQESQQSDKSGSSAPLIKKAIELIKLPDSPADSGLERNAIVHLRATLLWMINNGDSQAYDRNSILQRIRVNVGDDETLYDAFLQGIIDHESEDKRSRTISGLRRNIQGFVSRERVKDVLKKASHQAMFKETEIEDWDNFIQKSIIELSSIDMGGQIKEDPAFVKSVDFSNVDSVRSAMEEMQDSLSSEGIIKFPFQALNRATDDHGGGRRGELMLFPALPHNYKSGILMDIFVGACLFNDPYAFNKEKRPAIVFYSSEDDIPVMIKKLYVILKQIEFKCAVSIKGLDIDEATKYVMGKLTERGWNVFMHKVRPSLITYRKLFAHLEEYKSNGFEVCMVVCDYLGMFSREGCNNNSTGDDIQDLYRRVREFTNAEKILFVTAHQLSTDAKALARMKPDDFIHDLPGKGYYEGCRKIDTEVDFECYVNKRIVANGAFLEFLWGKHRKVGAPPEKDKYFVLKFMDSPMYGLEYDLLGEDLSYRVVGGKPNTEGGGKEWFDVV